MITIPFEYVNEVWIPITNKSVKDVKEGYYISSLGRAYSTLRHEGYFLIPQITNCGYLRIALGIKNFRSKYISLHRIVLMEFGYFDGCENYQVDHINGNKTDNRLCNLRWVSPSENISLAYQNGLKIKEKGEDCSYSTITNEQAEQIAKMIIQKIPHKEIASIIGCSISVVNDISTGSNWKSICDKYHLENYKRKVKLNFSNSDIEKLCIYFENNKNKYKYNSDLFRAALKELFNIEYNKSMSATMSRIFNHTTRRNIASKFD